MLDRGDYDSVADVAALQGPAVATHCDLGVDQGTLNPRPMSKERKTRKEP